MTQVYSRCPRISHRQTLRRSLAHSNVPESDRCHAAGQNPGLARACLSSGISDAARQPANCHNNGQERHEGNWSPAHRGVEPSLTRLGMNLFCYTSWEEFHVTHSVKSTGRRELLVKGSNEEQARSPVLWYNLTLAPRSDRHSYLLIFN